MKANLGAGTLTNWGGTSGLNGTAGAATVAVNAGTLTLGASDRLADAATVMVAAGATLNVGAFTDTIGTLALNGTLAGTGTLTAGQYQLTNAAVNANLGTGTLFQLGGTSVLAGTSATGTVAVNAGTLRLAAAERIADTAQVAVAANATFDLAGFNETVGSLSGAGAVTMGAGSLGVGGANVDASFTGTLTGTGDFTKTGTGTQSLVGNEALTGRLNVNAGTLLLAGSTAGAVRIQGGTLAGASTIAGNLLLSSGTLSPGSASQRVAQIQASSLTTTGGTFAVDFGGSTSGFTADTLKITGAASLSGTVVSTAAIDPSTSYKLEQTYQVLSAASISGSFANGTTFTQVSSANPDLYWRLRTDLVPNAVLLEIRRVIDFGATLGAGATGNQMAVGSSLPAGMLSASDNWMAILTTIGNETTAPRQATFDSIGGESTADISTTAAMLSGGFTSLLRQRLATGGAGDGSLVAGLVGGRNGLAQVRAGATADTGASALGGGGAGGSHGGAWVQGFGGTGHLNGSNGTATLYDQSYGVAAGIDARIGGITIGGAFAAASLDTDIASRASTNKGTLYQGGGYAAYDNGQAYASLIGSYFSGNVDSSRQVFLGTASQGTATGRSKVDGFTVGAAAGYRMPIGGGIRFTPQASFEATEVTRDAFTETGAGLLDLAVGRQRRNLYTATAEGRFSHVSQMGSWTVEPYAGAGAAFAFGDLNSVAANQFTGAPTGTGAFAIQGARLSPTTALLTGGVEAHPGDRITIGLGAETRLSDRQRDGRLELHLRLGF